MNGYLQRVSLSAMPTVLLKNRWAKDVSFNEVRRFAESSAMN